MSPEPDHGPHAGSPRDTTRPSAEGVEVAILFTDIEGSSRLWEQHPDLMFDALETHDLILADAVESEDGTVIDHTGDGMVAAFAHPESSLRAALDAQARLASRDWGALGALRVRMAIHLGQAHRRGDVYHGRAINYAARLDDAGHGGQVLVSEAAANGIESLPPGASLLDLGPHRLRDVADRAHVFQLMHHDLQPSHPPLRTPTSGPEPLPVPPGSLVGRSHDVESAVAALKRSPIVTLVGTPGVGKTRLALHAANVARDRFDDVTLIELAGVPNGDCTAAIANRLGIQRRRDLDLAQSITESLSGRSQLLVLDNCEHATREVATLGSAIAAQCPGARLLCTSSRPIGTTEERVIRINPLATPDPNGTLEEIRRSPAVMLWCERAQAVDPTFRLDGTNARAVATLCRALGGLPLAIELTAARAGELSPSDLPLLVDSRVTPLSDETVSDRHHSLATALESSFRLLEPEAQARFCELAVFAGPFTANAAASVSAVADETAVLTQLADLARYSLLVPVPASDTSRFRMLEPLRSFALKRLTAAEETSARDRHSRFFTERAESAAGHLRGPEEAHWVRRLELEFDDLRAAHDRALDEHDVDTSFRLLSALWEFAFLRLRYEYFDWVSDALAKFGTTDHLLEPVLLGIAGIGAWARQDAALAIAFADRAIEAERRLNAPLSVPARLVLVDSHAYLGNIEVAAQSFGEVVEWARELGDPFYTVNTKVVESFSLSFTDRSDDAVRVAENALAVARETNNPSSLAWAEFALGTALQTSDLARSESLLTSSVRHSRTVDNRWVIGMSLSSLASVRRRLGGPRDAAPVLLELLDLWERAGNSAQLWHAVREAAMCLGLLGDLESLHALCSAVDRIDLVMPQFPVDREPFETLLADAREELAETTDQIEVPDSASAAVGLATDRLRAYV